MHTIAPMKITDDQHKWLINRKKNTASTFAASIRDLIQKEVAKEDRAKKRGDR